jgi:hypothetical protein
MTDFCPGATIGATNFTISGSETFGADGTYTTSATVGGSVTVNFPASCLTVNGLTLTCAQLNQVFATMPDPSIKSFNCVGSSGCACTVTPVDQVTNESGTYTTTGAGLLTLTPTNGAPESDDYCVKGTSLTLSPHNGSTMMSAEVSGTIVLTKQ